MSHRCQAHLKAEQTAATRGIDLGNIQDTCGRAGDGRHDGQQRSLEIVLLGRVEGADICANDTQDGAHCSIAGGAGCGGRGWWGCSRGDGHLVVLCLDSLQHATSIRSFCMLEVEGGGGGGTSSCSTRTADRTALQMPGHPAAWERDQQPRRAPRGLQEGAALRMPGHLAACKKNQQPPHAPGVSKGCTPLSVRNLVH